MNRRTMLRRASESAVALLLADRWDISAPLWAQIAASGRTFDPRRYGAKGDGVSVDTRAIQEAIDTCTQSGGGTVLLSPGTYVSGTITLKSNVTLELQAGAKILGSSNYSDFVLPPEGLAATRGVAGQHLIFAINAQNIAILGPGVIDGNGPAYFAKGNHPKFPPGQEYKDIAALDTYRVHTISPMVDLANCTNVRVENITLQNAVGWTLHPVGCDQVLIKNVKVRNPINTQNTDGIDPCSCSNALITDCDVVTGDDGIDVKTLNPYGVNFDSRNVAVVNCKVSTCCNGLKIGAEGQGNFENINFSHCESHSAVSPMNERVIAGIAIEMGGDRGINGITYDDITITNARTPIFIRLQTTPGLFQKLSQGAATLHGSLRNVKITNVRATGAINTSSISGLANLPVQNVSLSNIQITTQEPGTLAWTTTQIPEKEFAYADSNMFGKLPSYGFYVRHVQGLSFENVSVKSLVGDPRPMLSCDDVQQLVLKGVDGTAPDPSQPFLDLKNTRAVRIQGNRAPVGTALYSRVSGAGSHDIQFQGNDLSRSKSPLMRTDDVPQDGVGSVN